LCSDLYKGPVRSTQADETPHPHRPLEGADRSRLPRRGRGLSLRTLIVLRWLAIIGQAATVLFANFALHFPLPLGACLAVITASVLMNIAATVRLQKTDGRLASGRETASQLGFDIVQLATLLALTGGLENPFCILLVAPVTVAAAALPARQALILGGLALLATAGLFFWSLPLPWRLGVDLALPTLYRFGMGLALVTGVVFTAGYAWRVAADAEKLELALAATQGVLEREQRLAALGGLAAAAAHELGTPLATIQVVAKELLRASPADGPVAEDARLLMEQANRCRDILKRLSQRPEDGDSLYDDVELKALLEEVVEPHRGLDLQMDCEVAGGEPQPRVRRLAELVHGLSALVENAADFAAGRVQVLARHDARWIEIDIVDDGPGFSADILSRLGEPYVTSRPHGKTRRALAERGRTPGRKKGGRTPAPSRGQAAGLGGMGLGFFIARTLLERTGAKVSIGVADPANKAAPGARVTVTWPREALEARI
jgi:two-component system sensor histidine kinase RegB